MSLTASAARAHGAAQPNLHRTADNVTNLGRVAKIGDETRSLRDGGRGMGVSVENAERIFDQHLKVAKLDASSEAGRWGAISRHLETASQAIGDVAERPQALERVQAQLSALSGKLDAEISAGLGRANDLFAQLNQVNSDISRARLTEGDQVEDTRSQLVDELASLMNVRVTLSGASLTVRSAEGLRLAGDGDAAKLGYHRADLAKGYVAVELLDGNAQQIQVAGGEIGGLIDLRDIILPRIADRLGEVWQMTDGASVAELGEAIGHQAQAAETSKNAALAVANEAAARQEAAERADVDHELAAMASYQQASNASARMAQAARALLAVLTR